MTKAKSPAKQVAPAAPAHTGAPVVVATVNLDGPPAPAPAPVAKRQPGIVAVALNPAAKPYRSSAAHTSANWQTLCAAIKAGNGVALVDPLLPKTKEDQEAAKRHTANGEGRWVPDHFVAYVVRRGYLLAVDAPPQAD